MVPVRRNVAEAVALGAGSLLRVANSTKKYQANAFGRVVHQVSLTHLGTAVPWRIAAYRTNEPAPTPLPPVAHGGHQAWYLVGWYDRRHGPMVRAQCKPQGPANALRTPAHALPIDQLSRYLLLSRAVVSNRILTRPDSSQRFSHQSQSYHHRRRRGRR